MKSHEEGDGKEVFASSNPLPFMKCSYAVETWGVLEMRAASISSTEPVTANAAKDNRKGKQGVVHPSLL